MKILTFDTSIDTMYVTISTDGNIDDQIIIKNTKEKFGSASLIPAIIELLKKYNLKMQDINAIGVNIGPGSFTGVRASSTIARVMGQQLEIPVVGVSSLQILSLINKTSKNSICLMDARKNKFYCGTYNSQGEEIEHPVALDKDIILDNCRHTDKVIISDQNVSVFLTQENIDHINFQEKEYDLGENLAKLTSIQLNKNIDAYKWYNLKPLYIQPPSITMPKCNK